MLDNAIEVVHLNKSYADGHQAISDLSFTIPSGSVYGLLGPNGAGKTTLVSIISGILSKSDGQVSILGATENKSELGLAPQEIALFELLNPLENLKYFGALQGLSSSEIKTKSESLLQEFGLWDVRKKQVKNFSGGMKRRLNLIVAMLHEPQILILDEPTEGIDVQSRIAILGFIKKLNAEKKTTIIYTSHILSEAEEICSQILIIDKGVKQVEGTLESLLGSAGQNLQDVFLKITGHEYRDSN